MTESRLDTKQQVKSLWSLGGLTIVQLAKEVWTEIDHDDVLNRASELAYNFLLSIFPLLLFLLSLLGIFAAERAALRDQLFAGLAHVVPPSASNLISQTIQEIAQSSGGGKLTFGIVFFLWSASGGISTMISVLNAAYHVHDSRPWYKVRAVVLGITLAVAILIILALTVVLFGGHIAGFVDRKIGLGTSLVLAWKVLQWPLALFFISFAFALVYYFGPDVKERHWYWITPGSIIGVLLWLVSSFGLRVYLHFFNSYSKTYGSLGGVMILLLWFYITGLAFLVGGEVNSTIEHAAAERGHPEAKPEGRKAA
ncbi:MAG TPA: YihY/virulence factor BrkB family protein [Terriglobales bacterium]|nr:YihY/virulence factor BrkB family protein [Terriglobales bacterium]